MSDAPEISKSESDYKQQLETTHEGLEISIAPVFAGFASNSDSIPFAFHAVTASLPDGRRVLLRRNSVLDSLRLVETEVSSHNLGGPETRYNADVLTNFLPESLRADGWVCARASIRLGNARSLFFVHLTHPDGREVTVNEFDEDILYALEDAAWCAANGLPGFQVRP